MSVVTSNSDDKVRVLHFSQSINWEKLGTCDVANVSKLSEAKFRLENDHYSVLAVSLEMNKEALELLKWASYQFPAVTRVVEESSDSKLTVQALNTGSVFAVVKKSFSAKQIENLISRAFKQHATKLHQTELLAEVREKNRRLQVMTRDQEQVVKNSTQHLADSKAEIERQVRRVRSLNRFIQDLSGLGSVEELLELLRTELKTYHMVKPPMLAYVTPQDINYIAYFQGAQVKIKSAPVKWKLSNTIRVNDSFDSQYLANLFGRPMAKTMGIPIVTSSGSQKTTGATLLFVEHSLPENELDSFLEFLSERLQPFAVALDRIFLERDLKYASLLWERTFDDLKEPIAIIDDESNLLRCNRAFSGKVSGKCYQQFDERGESCVGCPVPIVLKTGESAHDRVSRGDQVFEVHSYPIQYAVEEYATTVVNYYVDITNSETLHRQVIQSEKMAAIGQLAGNIAHELNNPLTGLRSLAQVLVKELSPGTNIYSDMVEVERAAYRCQLIIQNLLEFSSGDDEEKKITVDLNLLVQRTLPLLKTAMRQINCEVEFSKEATAVRIVPQLLQQVIFNIVNNACQAMEDGGTVTIKTQIVDRGAESEILLSIRDTGRGIPEQVVSQIFEPFFTTKKRGQGTGLGLSMSREIVVHFGGSIEVDSDNGKGSEFRIYLPRVESKK